MKPNLQDMALNIFSTCLSRGIDLDIQWLPRKLNERADYLSKIVDLDDWCISNSCFDHINSIWGPFTIDRFASSSNNKVPRFNSMFWNPGSEHVDCFSCSWKNENNWLVPPISLVGKCICHLVACKARGVLLVPYWPSSYFWPLLFQGQGLFHTYVADLIEFYDGKRCFVHGENKNSLFGSNRFYGKVLAIKLDATMC